MEVCKEQEDDATLGRLLTERVVAVADIGNSRSNEVGICKTSKTMFFVGEMRKFDDDPGATGWMQAS